MKTVILGGTKGMGRAIAQRLAERGDEVFLLGRDKEDLERSRLDLKARHPEQLSPGAEVCDLETPEVFESALSKAEEALGRIEAVIVTAAMFATQDELEKDVQLARRVSTVNFANTVTFCECARKKLMKQGGGKLVVFSSVAGERGRKPIIIYGATKAGLSQYLEGLDHKSYSQGLRVLCVKPGFVKTGMTVGLKPPPFASEPEVVATDVINAVDRNALVLYTPRMWALVMLVIRHLPRFVMRKIGF